MDDSLYIKISHLWTQAGAVKELKAHCSVAPKNWDVFETALRVRGYRISSGPVILDDYWFVMVRPIARIGR
jgi:hypothetical protein